MEKLKNLIARFKPKKWNKNLTADFLVITSFFIVFGTTATLNIHIAMYLLAVGLFIMAYFISKPTKS